MKYFPKKFNIAKLKEIHGIGIKFSSPYALFIGAGVIASEMAI